MPELFDPEDPKDSNGILWANRALHVVEKELLKQRRVILGGFSMGGVIASWIASMLPVEKLILIAPAFDLINPEEYRQYSDLADHSLHPSGITAGNLPILMVCRQTFFRR